MPVERMKKDTKYAAAMGRLQPQFASGPVGWQKGGWMATASAGVARRMGMGDTLQ